MAESTDAEKVVIEARAAATAAVRTLARLVIDDANWRAEFTVEDQEQIWEAFTSAIQLRDNLALVTRSWLPIDAEDD